MVRKFSLVAGLFVMATAFGTTLATAAPAMPQSTATGVEEFVQKVHYRGRCRAWRHECAARWGWGTRGYHRCLWRHGC
ncbi:MAG: hypothetical protein F9K29_04705 [Hyphomicrobiaceae bacterium]|nr:MAG: hypothetical protein F9K29_04705 [Hyphomicrobiaceae bacterium]